MTNMNCFACFAEVMDLYHHHKDYKGQIYGGMHAGVRGLGGLVSDFSSWVFKTNSIDIARLYHREAPSKINSVNVDFVARAK